jgi:hypothetical protein
MSADREKNGETDERPLARHSLPYPASRLSAPIELVDLAKEIEQADQVIGMVASAKLQVIRDQMRALQEQARAVLEEAQTAMQLHRARCHFKKVPGHVYHLYRDSHGAFYFSMLSPEEWGGNPPHAFEGSYRVEVDMSFTPIRAAHL